MIIKLLINVDNKLLLNKFLINRESNKIIIKSLDIVQSIIKVPIYNTINGIDYYPVLFPLIMPIKDEQVFNPYIILSSYNFNFQNELDFFSQISEILVSKFNLNLISFENLLENVKLFSEIINQHYLLYINFNILKEITNINNFINELWMCINLCKLFTIYTLIKYSTINNKNIKEITKEINLNKKMFVISNNIKLLKYNLMSQTDNAMNFIDYYSTNFEKPLMLDELKPNFNYYIVIDKTCNITDTDIIKTEESKYTNKIMKINIKKIIKNIIEINQLKNIIFENYKWYNYHPNIKMDKSYIIYQTFINNSYTTEIITNGLVIDNIHSLKILEYYMENQHISNLISLNLIYDNLKEFMTDMNILKLNSYSDSFFDYITKKYSNNDKSKIFEILEILFSNYNYPFKNNRHELDSLFNNILYFSVYNYKHIWVHNKFNLNTNIDLLHPDINSFIPGKLKNLYINLMKMMCQVINDDFDAITYNQKFYSDYLHKNVIKILITDTTNLTPCLFKTLTKPLSYEKFKNIVQTNSLLIDIGNRLTWSNLPKKLNYLNIFYKNESIVFYQDKLNKNIIPDTIDYRIKKIIENPFEMYKYMRKEKDFIRWTKFISNKIIQLYLIPISLSTDDFNYIGKLIYLLFNITEQNIKDETYINFINFCHEHSRLVLDNNRINLKIREYFPSLKCNINLGFFAKHLTWNKETISFDENNIEKSVEILNLELKLQNATKKYYKYKAKYLESKDIEINKKNISDTSSIMP